MLAPFVRGADAPQMLEKATPDELKLLQSKGAYWWCANNAPADAHPIVFCAREEPIGVADACSPRHLRARSETFVRADNAACSAQR